MQRTYVNLQHLLGLSAAINLYTYLDGSPADNRPLLVNASFLGQLHALINAINAQLMASANE